MGTGNTIAGEEMKAKSWKKELPDKFWIFTGVGESSTIYSRVTVVGYESGYSNQGVSLSFNRSDESDHLVIHMSPALARDIGKKLMEMADYSATFPVMRRLKGG